MYVDNALSTTFPNACARLGCAATPSQIAQPLHVKMKTTISYSDLASAFISVIYGVAEAANL